MLVFRLKTRLIDINQFPVSAHTQIVSAHSQSNTTGWRMRPGNGHGIALQIAAKHHRPLKKPALTLRRTPPANAARCQCRPPTRALPQAQKKTAPKECRCRLLSESKTAKPRFLAALANVRAILRFCRILWFF